MVSRLLDHKGVKNKLFRVHGLFELEIVILKVRFGTSAVYLKSCLFSLIKNILLIKERSNQT
jgi:hypothetical protein